MNYQEILMMIAPSLAGVSLTTLLSLAFSKFIKKRVKAKIDEIGENAEFKKVNDKLDTINEKINRITGDPK